MRLEERSLGPPGGWGYTQKESGVAFRAITFGQLLEMVGKHRRGNKYDTSPGWEERFEEEFCQQNQLVGTQWCPDREAEARAPRLIGLADVRRFLNSALSMVQAGGDMFVSQEEAERRAAICSECPNNAAIGGCVGCNGVRALVSKVRGSRTTAQDSRLRQCTVCGCDNQVKVWLKDSVVDNEGLNFPDHCWAKKPSPDGLPAPAP